MKPGKHFTLFPLILFALLQITMLAAVTLTPVAQSATTHPTIQAAFDLSGTVAALVDQADIVVRAQVVQSESQWNSSHTLIETEHVLAVRYPIIGKNATDLVVRTDGGFLPAEGLGMRASHTASFAPGEEVLIFLQETTSGYRVAGGEAGKFSVVNAEAVSAYYREHQALSELAMTILTSAKNQGRSATLPADWQSYELASSARQVDISKQLQVDPKWPGATPKINVKVNVNSTHIGDQGGSAEQFLTAIKNALRTWSVVPEAEFTLLYNGTTTATNTGFNNMSEILFMKKGANSQVGQAQIWFTAAGTIVEADVWLNDDYALDATGSPEGSEIDVESSILHELGHWLPLAHISNASAVMYAVLGAGTRRIVLSSDDLAGITALYPCPAAPCIDPAYASDTTATPTSTVTVTISSTVTATPTPTSTFSITPGTPTVTMTPTLIPSAVTPVPESGIFLPLITR